MRYLAVAAAALLLAGPAAAGSGFALYDLQTDLARASRNVYGDVQAKPHAALAGHGTLARCAAWCRFGAGWLAFRTEPRLQAADVSAAAMRFTKRKGWVVELSLRPIAQRRWAAFAQRLRAAAAERGVPDVLVVVAAGQVAAAPYSSQVGFAHGRVTLTGFSRASADALVKSLA